MKLNRQFKLNTTQVEFQGFKKIISMNSNFIREEIISEIPQSAGIYFWVLEINDITYKVYIGRTTNLNRRTNEYLSNFQPASPNDFKISFFMSWLSKNNLDWELKLFFTDVNVSDLVNKENYFIDKFDMNNSGIINGAVNVNISELKDIYERYYFDRFNTKINSN